MADTTVQDAAPRKKTQRDPFEVKLSKEKEAWLVDFLARELDYAVMARLKVVGDDGDLDDAHDKYRGGDPALTKDTPWPGASNLGSYLATEAVDALRARIMATVFTDPLWVVEGFGKAAERAPIVEEFHTWKADQTKLHLFVSRAVHNALVEGTGVLEVFDRISKRKARRRINARLQQDPATGLLQLDDQGKPIPMKDDGDYFIEADDSSQPSQSMIINEVVRSTAGPAYRVHSLKDFYILPGHVGEIEDVWGYAKRLYRRLTELKQSEDNGYYKNIDQLGGASSSERLMGATGVSDSAEKIMEGTDIAPQQAEETAEKEIWELTLLLDLDDDGFDEWYIVTWSQNHRQLLRVQYEDYNTPHYILLTPFPRPNSVYGFSYVKDKLGSIYDEHTALRNMFADRMLLKTNAPLLVTEGSLFNPSAHPWAPGRRLMVRDVGEIKQLEVADVPSSVPAMIKEVLMAAERVRGMNDTTTGQTTQAGTTLGEVKLVAQQSWVRIDEVVKNMQQGFEDLFQILNTIWEAKLQDNPEPWPGDILISMQQRAIQFLPGDQITSDVLRGPFRGKPRGSVEASDFAQMRGDTVQLITAITQLAQRVPALEAQLNNPATIRSILTQIARIYRWPDRMNLVGNFSGQPPPPPPAPPGMGGAPGGAPPGQPPPNVHGGRPRPGAPRRPAPGAANHPPMGVPGVSNMPNLPQAPGA